MLNLESIITNDERRDVQKYMELRFSDASVFKTPEALALYEQRILPEDRIKELCEEVYGLELTKPLSSYVPDKFVVAFENSGYVPINFQPMRKVITVVYLPELVCSPVEVPGYSIEKSPVTIYDYMKEYMIKYGVHPSLLEIPAKLLFDNIVSEALKLGAADITITNEDKATRVYYNVRKKRVDSHYVFRYEFAADLIQILTIKSPNLSVTRTPKDVDIDENLMRPGYRGRGNIAFKFGGYVITIRILPNDIFNSSLDEWNLSEATVQSIRDNVLDRRKGLRLLVGETFSGKNTTAQAALHEIAAKKQYKIVAVGKPIEQRLPGVEQMSADTDDEYTADVQALVRMNPDFVYLEEIRDTIAKTVMEMVNTGKCVMSTLHANSVADTISRLMDISGMSQDRVIQTLHSIYYQELIRDEEKDIIYPKNRYVIFTDELKYELYGKSLGEVIRIITDVEEGDVWTSLQQTKL